VRLRQSIGLVPVSLPLARPPPTTIIRNVNDGGVCTTASLLESFLDGELYEALKCSQIAQNLTEVVKGRMKELSLPRYKFISHVMIGQNASQGITHASRSLWNTSTDNYASATYQNGSLFAIATVFAVFYE